MTTPKKTKVSKSNAKKNVQMRDLKAAKNPRGGVPITGIGTDSTTSKQFLSSN
jgi:hypothetical protein